MTVFNRGTGSKYEHRVHTKTSIRNQLAEMIFRVKAEQKKKKKNLNPATPQILQNQHSSPIHIETYQLVRNQFLLISLIMCHQHHQ